jgi:hypothetical protein
MNIFKRLYSFFGFGTYVRIADMHSSYRILFWCCFPFYFIRKFDLVKWKIESEWQRTHRLIIEAEQQRNYAKAYHLKQYLYRA